MKATAKIARVTRPDDVVKLKISLRQAAVFRAMYYAAASGDCNGPRGDLEAIDDALEAAGVQRAPISVNGMFSMRDEE